MKSIVWRPSPRISGGPSGGDALDPADEYLGVYAVDVHPRPVDVEVAQRHVVQAVHRVIAAQQTLVEQLRRAIQRLVGVGVVLLRRREPLGHPVHGRGRGGDDLAHPRLDGGVEHIGRATDQHVEREPGLLRAAGDPQGRLMEYDVDAVEQPFH